MPPCTSASCMAVIDTGKTENCTLKYNEIDTTSETYDSAHVHSVNHCWLCMMPSMVMSVPTWLGTTRLIISNNNHSTDHLSVTAYFAKLQSTLTIYNCSSSVPSGVLLSMVSLGHTPQLQTGLQCVLNCVYSLTVPPCKGLKAVFGKFLPLAMDKRFQEMVKWSPFKLPLIFYAMPYTLYWYIR